MKSGHCTIMCNGRDCGPREMNHHQPHRRLVFIKDDDDKWWYWMGVLCYELPLENQMINPNMYCSQLNQLKPALNEECPESVQRKHKIFIQDSARLCFFDDQTKTVTAWTGSSDLSVVFTSHYTFRFPFMSIFTDFS